MFLSQASTQEKEKPVSTGRGVWNSPKSMANCCDPCVSSALLRSGEEGSAESPHGVGGSQKPSVEKKSHVKGTHCDSIYMRVTAGHDWSSGDGNQNRGYVLGGEI